MGGTTSALGQAEGSHEGDLGEHPPELIRVCRAALKLGQPQGLHEGAMHARGCRTRGRHSRGSIKSCARGQRTRRTRACTRQAGALMGADGGQGPRSNHTSQQAPMGLYFAPGAHTLDPHVPHTTAYITPQHTSHHSMHHTTCTSQHWAHRNHMPYTYVPVCLSETSAFNARTSEGCWWGIRVLAVRGGHAMEAGHAMRQRGKT